jgi:L-alanine-DL-glutamate epimerase-like enolase superfamily enzyme
MPRGAARNALDCALWSLEAEQLGRPVWALAGLPPPRPLVTAYTLSLGEPAAMEAAARRATAYPLLKLKLAGEGDRERVAAVRRGAPDARLIVDANEAWNERDIADEAAALAALGVELVEQPVRAGEEARLDGIRRPIPFAADESCQDRDDLDRCAGRFDAVNVKLDKAGGLTAALLLARDARDRGMAVMVGCMLATSLGIAPAYLLAQQARWVDLDGPLLLARDRPDGFRFDGAMMRPSAL